MSNSPFYFLLWRDPRKQLLFVLYLQPFKFCIPNLLKVDNLGILLLKFLLSLFHSFMTEVASILACNKDKIKIVLFSCASVEYTLWLLDIYYLTYKGCLGCRVQGKNFFLHSCLVSVHSDDFLLCLMLKLTNCWIPGFYKKY